MAIRSFTMILSACFSLSLLSTGQVLSQENTPEKTYMQRLKAIHVTLTEMGPKRERQIAGWLEDPYTGFPNLADILIKSLVPPKGGCKTPGPMLPLDVIEGWCRKTRKVGDNVILDHKSDEVREAYVQTWLERHPGVQKPTIDDLLAGGVDLAASKPASSLSSDRTIVLQELAARHIRLTKVSGKEEMMWRQIDSTDSGYQDLLQVLFKAIPKPKEDKVKGPLLPLDALEGWCRKLRKSHGKASDADTVIYDHTAEEVRDAYVKTWDELNSDPRDLTSEQILRGE